MSQSDAGPTLVASLAAEGSAWQALLNVLREEESALVEGNADLLAPLNAVKLTQLHTLSNLARTRHDELSAAGHAPDHAGMDAWLARHGQPEHLARWQQLCDMEREAQAMNQRIGTLIEMRLSSTRQALNVLVHAATSRNSLYDQAGQAVTASKGKPLAAA